MRLILSIAILLFGFGYHWLTGWYPAVDWLQAAAMQTIWPAVVCLLALVVILVARLRNPGDPAIVAWMALGLAGSLLIIPLLVAKEMQSDHDQARREALAALREQAQTRLRQIEQDKLDAMEKQIPEGSSDRFAQYRGRIDALTLGRLRLLDSQMEQDVKARAEAYRQALDENPTRGPNSWVTFRTPEDLEQELEAHRKLYAATRAFTDFIEGFEDSYTNAIEEAGLKPPANRIAIAEMERVLQSWEQTNIYEIRQLDVAILAAALKALNILSDEWGNWSYSPRDERISFEDPTSERAFFEAVQTLQAASEAVGELTNPEESE